MFYLSLVMMALGLATIIMGGVILATADRVAHQASRSLCVKIGWICCAGGVFNVAVNFFCALVFWVTAQGATP